MLKKLSFIILLIWFSACMNENESNTDTIKTNKSETPSEEEAKYELTFNALWSSATHPVDFPSSPHFSGLIGMTHNGDVQLFAAEKKATSGIKNMAEVGSKSPLSSEIDAWISEKKAKSLISGGGIGRSPGSLNVEFTIEKSHSLVSVVSMIAPSPDWYVAIRDIALYEEDKWVTEKTVEVGVYDAGTDAGQTFSAPNKIENKTIQKITTPPLAVNGIVKRMGTM
ncbi:MAG: hypothetical protein GWP29_07150, partial [Bacteroidetes bacterium]|nr:hypothetical protein [Bacteroidota bacterium]